MITRTRVKPLDQSWWLQLALTGAFIGFAALVGFTAHCFAKWDVVAQEWAPYLDKMTPDQQNRAKGWFKDQRSSHGVPCCDQADGHPTDYDIRDSGYWIPDPIHLDLPRQWVQVPPEAVIHNTGNPVGEAVVWWTAQTPDTVYIRCFIPGGGV